MSVFGNKTPRVSAVKKVGRTGNMKSGAVFSVKNGLGSLTVRRVDECNESFTSVLMLNGRQLTQIETPYCSTCEKLLAAGYGIENADCAELRAVSEAVNSDFVSVEHSLEVLSPLLGLLKDGVYLLADVECFPTDGESKFFWAVEPKKKLYEAAVPWLYISSEDHSDVFDGDLTPPVFLYPTQSAARFDRERAEYYRSRIAADNSPRAIAYNAADGISFLLDGHHKAAAAALEGKPVKCLLIVPEQLAFVKSVTGAFKFISQRFTPDVIFERPQLSAKEFAGIVARWELMQARPERPEPDLMLNKTFFNMRGWEQEFTDSARRYPSARQLVLEKIFGIAERYEEIAAYLEKFVTDKEKLDNFALKDPFGLKDTDNDYYRLYSAMKLLFMKAAREGDRRLKYIAIAAAGMDCFYYAVREALRYLLIFKNDPEVEELFIGIISDPELYDRYGHIAIDFWEDEPQA